MTDITIIGTGNMAAGIAARAASAGRSIQILSRDAVAASALASETNASVGTTGKDIEGSIVILATFFDVSKEIASRYGTALDGKTIVDISNPVNTETYDSLTVPAGSSAAEEIQALVPGANVVKGFNTVFAATLAAGEVAGQTLDVLLAGDSDEAKAAVASFINDSGLRAIDVGPLRRARELEAFQLLVVGLQLSGAYPEYNWNSALKLLP
ncbi:NADPH-dependent F420 reductase [Arthrobacter sp. B10-11]|uniref:NADPH-dependent F420 reductase n=1 Tax=Arthrobacter sp. B10-11 TaxID=3081160 RepID=UPI002954FF85|nr:NAD(P)-binding domain-containing protein [Arthrobacter sp. B10-11]MDV8149929.1 NAD(P)-binding domain-containing protein [Arthrobacter sp. B10-11]